MNRYGQYLVGIAACVAVLAAVFTAGCSGGGKEGDLRPPVLYTNIYHDQQLIGGIERTWSVSWNEPDYMFGGYSGRFVEPYTVSWDFGGGAEPNTVTVTMQEDDCSSRSTTAVRMLNDSETEDATYTATVKITDVNGLTTTDSLEYTIGPAYQPLEITQTNYNINSFNLTVEAEADSRALPVTLTLAPPDGVSAIANEIIVEELPVSAAFNLAATDVFAGGSGQARLTVTDHLGFQIQQIININVPVRWLAGDTLYVLPETNEAGVGETVRIFLATSEAAYPFYYASDVCVTFPDWVHYVPYTLDSGCAGGANADSDGIWGADGINAESMQITMSQFIVETAVPGVAGRNYISCQVRPLGGHQAYAASGALFNFKVSFDHAGTASFGLLPSSTGAIDRTYYRDEADNLYVWGTLMANADGSLNLEGWDNTIVVTE